MAIFNKSLSTISATITTDRRFFIQFYKGEPITNIYTVMVQSKAYYLHRAWSPDLQSFVVWSDDVINLFPTTTLPSCNVNNLTNKHIYLDSGVEYVDTRNEIPTGTINGSNTVFTLSDTPINNDVIITINGVKQTDNGGSPDYSVNGSTVTFSVAPPTGSFIEAFYITSGSSVSVIDASLLFNGNNAVRSVSGYRDLMGEINLKGSGGGIPTWTQMTALGSLWAYAFNSSNTMNEVWVNYHIDHDYKPGGNVFLHAHWTTNGTNTGTVRWNFEYSIAKGHNQSSDSTFGTSTTISVEQAGSGVAYRHMVAEINTALPTTKLEPDSLILVRIYRDPTHVNDTLSGDTVFLLQADCHYETDRYATLNRSPNFYGS
jgi:hypothetical protein